MNIDSIIKIVFLFGILYLFFNPVINQLLEKFNIVSENNDNTKSGKLGLKSADNKLYYFVSFFDLNDNTKKIVLEEYFKQKALDDSNKITLLESSFLFDENSLTELTIDKIPLLTFENFSINRMFNKVPVFIISAEDLPKYTKSMLILNTLEQSGYTIFTHDPNQSQYLFYNEKRKILYYSKNEYPGASFIKTDIPIAPDGILKNVIIDKSITNITPVEMKSNNDVFKYYTLNSLSSGTYTWVFSN